MLTIDGSQLEGGGQIVRTVVALSALTGVPVELLRIRENRKRPGLGNQHCAAVRAVAATCDARVFGNSPGSRTLRFLPGSPRNKDIRVDVGTAGSVPLVIQAWLPVALEHGGCLEVHGGTEVPKSPTIDYLTGVFLPALGPAAARVTVAVRRRGYYPAGGGMVRVEVFPGERGPLRIRPRLSSGIRSCSSGLPEHVADRQAAAAFSVISRATGEEFPVTIDRTDGPGKGSSCTVWKEARGSSALGRIGLPAEKVGQAAARGLLDEMGEGGETDGYLGDQLLPYLGRYGGSYTCGHLTLHARTVRWILDEFGFPVQIKEGHPVEFSA
ncbi:MAG: RNA 3'-phosphate cyclase [Methanoregulaceae archaeon]|nr:RNA 3'-phosphate cyclase [Methanoregulaceae archaeon]